MGSSYTRCNLTKITYFLGHKFLKDIMVKIGQLSINIVLLHIYDLPHSLSLSLIYLYGNGQSAFNVVLNTNIFVHFQKLKLNHTPIGCSLTS